MNRLAAGLLATICTEPTRVNELAQEGLLRGGTGTAQRGKSEMRNPAMDAHWGLLCRPKGPDMSAYMATVRQFSRKMC
jgi:hypothetical protein